MKDASSAEDEELVVCRSGIRPTTLNHQVQLPLLFIPLSSCLFPADKNKPNACELSGLKGCFAVPEERMTLSSFSAGAALKKRLSAETWCIVPTRSRALCC